MTSRIKIWTKSVAIAAWLCAVPVAAQDGGNPFESTAEDTRESERRTADELQVELPERIEPAQGQDGPVGQSPSMTIGAVNVHTDAHIPQAEIAKSYEAFIGEAATVETLRALANSIVQLARDHGYVFASAQIPPQLVKLGVVTVELDLGEIDEVRIVGSENARLRKILAPLARKAPRAELVERQLLLAGDLPGIDIVKTNYLSEGDRGVLVVEARETKAEGYLAIDNYGPDRFGPVRSRLRFDLNGVFADDDTVTLNTISTIAQPRELAFLSARYARTFGDGGTVVGVAGSAGRTRSGAGLTQFDLRGRNRYVALFASQALTRTNTFNLWLNGELAYQSIKQTEAGIPFEDDEMVTASLNFAANRDVGIGRIYGGIGATRELGILDVDGGNQPAWSRNDRAMFTKAYAWIDSSLDLGDSIGLRLAGNGQVASSSLPSSQEIAIGGPFYGRAYDFSERFGAEGVMGLAELRKDYNDPTEFLDWVQFYVFVDGGHVSNSGFAGGTLASAGGGVRGQLGPVDFGIESAAPLTRNRRESGDKSPQLNLHAGFRF